MIHKAIISVIVSILISSMPAGAWNKVGHDAIAYIAECHLTPRAKANIERYLDGYSIVYYASWLDKVRLQPAYAHTHKWHGSTVTPEGKYMRRTSGNWDAVMALDRTIRQLENHSQMTDSAVAVDIRILVHVIADMHCPGHVSFEDRPQAQFRFKLRGEEFLFHNYWDAAPDNSHKWYYTDYQYNLDRWPEAERVAVTRGTPREWTEEHAAVCRPIYDLIHPGDELDRAQTYDFQLFTERLTDELIVKAAYRLAAVLNNIFDY